MNDLVRMLRHLVVVVVLTTTGQVRAGDVYLIAYAALDLTPAEVKEIFLGEVQFSGTTRLLPVDNAGAHSDFLARVLKMPGVRYSASWTKKAFRDGLNPPPMKATDAEVLGFVKGNPGAIGYVTTAPQGVTVIGKF